MMCVHITPTEAVREELRATLKERERAIAALGREVRLYAHPGSL